MTLQHDLFGSGDPTSIAVMPMPAARGPQLTPQQQRFNRLVARIGKMTGTLADRQQLADAHRLRHAARIEPLRREQRSLHRDMVLFLHGRLQRKGWTRPQQRTMKAILCALVQPLILEGDAQMLALHDLYSDDTFEQQRKAELEGVGTVMEDILGVSLEGQAFDSMEELLHEGLRQAHEKAQAAVDAQAEAEEVRQARRAGRKPGKRQQKAELTQQDAQAILREVYRKLASALHPDREQDAGERERKSALMSEVNTAYERRDLLTLLQLQLRIEQIDPHAIGQLTAKKLDAMMALLKDQAKSLEEELWQVDEQIRMEFELPQDSLVSAATLSRHLNVLESGQRADIAAMQQDRQRIESDPALRRWLKEQQKLMDEPDLSDLLDLAMFGGSR